MPGRIIAFFLCAWIVQQFAVVAALKSVKLAGGFTKPVFVTQRPGDNDRLFIVEQHSGRIRIFKFSTATTNQVEFLRVTGLTTGGEQGLLGLAFDPGYETNGFLYVNYTTTGLGTAGQTQVARFKANGEPVQAETADPASKTVLVNFAQPEANHNGGWIGFGKDGYLYISTGDGGSGNDPHGPIGNGQNRSTPLGKILRLRMPQGDELRAEAPLDNPYKGHATFLESIWAFGLRNPWRCSFDRLTGDLWIGDVGQGAREEIDINPAGVGGLNFGWRPREGFIPTPGINEQTVTPRTEPLHDYPRSLGISVTGGYRYRGSAVPELAGLYIFADYGTSRFWTMHYEDGTTNVVVTDVTSQLNPSTPSPRPIGNVSSFGEDNSGELYICDYAGGTTNAGEIYRILSADPPAMRLGGMTTSEDGKELVFTFNARAGKTYEVESISVLSGTDWTTMKTMDPPTTNTTMTVNVPMTEEAQYFRVKELP
jgi:glucose/arabinose dehydrogenase